MGTNKRKQVIEHIEDDETDIDEVSVQPTRPLDDSEELLDDMENNDISSAVNCQDIRTAEDYIQYKAQEKSRTQERNHKIKLKRLDKEEMVEKIRDQEQRREKMDELRTAVLASCMSFLDDRKNKSVEERVNNPESHVSEVKEDISDIKKKMLKTLLENKQ
jgi:hypothetical protein